jgi:hypothetical protein
MASRRCSRSRSGCLCRCAFAALRSGAPSALDAQRR